MINNSKLNKEEFIEEFGKFLSNFAEKTNDIFLKSLYSSARFNEKIKGIVDERLIKDEEYCEKVYNFLEQLNKLTDDFIKEYK